ncbi:hypothetical protein BRC82_01100 [Halobacteriales archaeon QS_1_67_19]|nr:MAG: hypothetical protein BRC82_01100 [Halobacteriales archaeon QS_1_67_19]
MTADEELTARSDSDESSDDVPDDRDRPADDHRNHLTDIEDGSGCTEIWEQLSERRERNDEDDGDE